MDIRKLNKLRLEFLKKYYIIYEKYLIEDNNKEAFHDAERKLMLETLAKMGFFE